MPPISPLINTALAWTFKYENIHNMESEILVRNEQKRDIWFYQAYRLKTWL